MRQFVRQFRINGKPMLSPDTDVTARYTDLDSADGGRDESGAMHRIVLRHKLGTWSFCYSQLSEEERRYLEELFPEGDFLFTHPDRLNAQREVTCRAYRRECVMRYHNALKGQWRDYKFEIVEC